MADPPSLGLSPCWWFFGRGLLLGLRVFSETLIGICKPGSMLSVLRVRLPSEIPVVGCEITPYVLIRRPDSSISNEDVSEAAPLGGCYMRCKWHRIQSDRKVAVCGIHLTEQATLQCIGCLKAKVPPSKSFHCSPKCFSDAWQHHLVLHDRASNAAVNGNGIDEEELFGRIQTSSVSSLSNGFATVYPASVTERNGNLV